MQRVCAGVITATGRGPVLPRSERQVKGRGRLFLHELTHRGQALGSPVQCNQVQSLPNQKYQNIPKIDS